MGPCGALRQSQPHGFRLLRFSAWISALTTDFFVAAVAGCIRTARSATTATFQSDDTNSESHLPGNFRLHLFKYGRGELLDVSTFKARQMNVVYGCLGFVEVLLAVQVHEIEFIDQAKLFQKFKGSVDCSSIDLPIPLLCKRKQTCCVKVAVSLLNDFEQNLPLFSDADA